MAVPPSPPPMPTGSPWAGGVATSLDGVPPPPATPTPPSAWGSGMATALGVVLASAFVLALADAIQIGGGVAFVPALLGVWSILALPIALGVGVLLASGNATWGVGWVRRAFRQLREDDPLDRRLAAILIAVAVLAGVLALAIKILTIKLVVNAQRQTSGALLLGVTVVGVIPLLALAILPLYRIARLVMSLIPAIGPLSRVVMLMLGAAFATVAAGSYVVLTQYDYQAINLKSVIVPALLLPVALVLALVAYGPAARLRERIPRRGTLAFAAGGLALLLPLILVKDPSRETQDAIMERSYFGGPLIKHVLRPMYDFDGDGFSPLFGGPDCDDSNPNVNPDAPEIPGNGIDDNCLGGDAPLVAPKPNNPDKPRDAGAGPAITGGQNVVVIFVDTLRFDRLGIAGYKRDGKSLTPRIDAFAAQSVVFDKAYAQAPNTPRSVPSFLTSHFPSQVKYQKRFADYGIVLDDNDTWFEAMKAGGFHTVGESSHFYFCDRVRYPNSCEGVAPFLKSNMIQGADEWDNDGAENIPGSNKDIAGPRIVKKTIAKLDELAKGKGKFALLVHLFEPHSSYMNHSGFTYVENSLAERYDYEIAFEDQMIGELLDGLDKSGLAKTTTVVLMSDHGEAFGVHRFGGKQMFFHGQTLYNELIHVPLIFRVPGVAPRTAHDVVQLIDLAPTVTHLFGITTPASWQGRSLVPALAGQKLDPQPAFAELLPAPEHDFDAKSIISADGKRHIFYIISERKWELYDLASDPDEKKDLDINDAEAKKLQQQLVEWIEGPLRAGAVK